jgi:hypothetical protein
VTVELLPAPPHISGPSWRKTLEGQWWLPEKTLGWGVLNWWAQYVKTPGGDHAGEAFMPTLEQARWALWWYAVDDAGRYAYRNGVLRRMKGWGKDPLAAALALVELCGPVAFDKFDASGSPVGKRRHAAWVQIVAVSQEQTKNTMSLFPVMVSSQLKEDYTLEVNKTIIYSEAGGRIEAVTSSPYSMEGNRPTLVIRNETQWWQEANDGHDLAGVIEGNVTKIPGSRVLSICNAHIPGEDSVAERDYDAWQSVQSGDAVDVGTLYDALEAPADTPVSEIPSERENPEGYTEGVAKLREGIEIARGDSVWLPVDTIVESVLDVRNPVTESRRKFLNQVNAHEDSWIAPYEWDAVADPTAKLVPGDRITLGFDGSKSNDWTALVACRVEDGCLFLIGVWNPEKYDGQIPREDVDAVVRSCFERYEVVAFRADVKEFESYVDAWSRDFKKQIKVNASPNNPIAFDMRGQTKRFSFDCEKFLDAVLEEELSHSANVTLRQHVLNARRYPTTYDAISIRKASKDSSKKIDAAVCCVLAFGARQDFLMSKRNRSRKVAVIQ